MAMTGRDMIEAARQAVPSTPNTELHRQLTAGENVVVLDVREPDEWSRGYISQATLLARGRIEGRIEDMVLDKSTPIVTH